MNIPRMGATEDPAKYAETLRKLVQDEFNRLSTDFYRFRQDTLNAAVIPLRAVSAITTDPSAYGVAVTWENPQQDTIQPTHVRIRILEIADTWAEYSYPKNTWEFNGLLPGTQYTVNIQLIARYEDTVSFVSATRNCPSLPVQRVAESEIRSRTFTTDPGVGPPGQGTGNTTTFPFPEAENPGTVGGADCWWEYMIQLFDITTWEDTIYTDEIDGNADLVDFDQTVLDCTRLYRMNIREVCNSVPGAWQNGTPFIPACDWTDPCGGVSGNDSAADAPFSTADLFEVPKACTEDDQYLVVEDGVSGINMIKMDGFDTFYREGDWTVVGTNPGSLQYPLMQAQLPLVGDLTGQDDFTVQMDVFTPAVSAGVGTYIMLFLGTKFRISINQVPSGFTFSMIAPWDLGGTMNLTSTTIIPVGTWVTVGARVDADGLKSLWIDGVKEAESVNAIELDLNGMTDDFAMFALEDIEYRRVYGWNRALADDEIGIVPNPVLSTIVYVATGDVATTVGISGAIMQVDNNTLLISADTGQGLTRIDITDRENPVVTHTLLAATLGAPVIYGVKQLVKGASEVWVSYYTTHPDYRHAKISTADLSVISNSADSAMTGWTGTQSIQNMIELQLGGDNYWCDPAGDMNYVNGVTNAAVGGMTGGDFLGADGEEPDWIPELSMALARRATTTVKLWTVGTPTNPTEISTPAFTGSNPNVTRPAYVSASELAIAYFNGSHYLALFDPTTGTNLDEVTGADVRVSDNFRTLAYVAEGRTWIIHHGAASGSDTYLVAREVVASAFQTPYQVLMTAANGNMKDIVLVGNYIYGIAKTGMVTYRIDA